MKPDADPHSGPALKDLLAAWRDEPPPRPALRAAFDTTDLVQAGALLRAWDASGLQNSVTWPAAQRIHVALCGFSTLNYLVPHVRWAALADGFIPQISLGGYNQLVQDLSRPDSPVTAADVDLIWVWADLEDLLPAEFVKAPKRLASADGLAAALAAADLLADTLTAARQHTKALLVANDFVPLRRSPLGVADGSRALGYETVSAQASARLRERLASIGSTCVLPLGHHLRRLGLEQAVDPRLQLMADCRFTPECFFRLAGSVRPYIRALRGAVSKVLVLDLDNTLWGGVVGEDSWDGVRIGTDPVGKAYAAFQKAILELVDRGVILAINSKNNPDDVREVFARREEMLLGLDNFASIQTNWQDKAANCRVIAAEINVGLDSLVFWDDDAAERLLVRETLPEVIVVEPPDDPSAWADALREMTLFDALALTEEDAERGRMYAQERCRREASTQATDLNAFLASLDLKVTCAPASDENIPRLASLLARTNQYNLTTRRHPEAVVREWAADPNRHVMSYAAKDRFGSYGIVGLTILERTPDAAVLDTLLLSCRAIGKGVEDVMLATIAQQARSWGVRRIRAAFIPTKKNAPVRTFLPDHGSTATGEHDGQTDYVLNLEGRDITFPETIRVEMKT